MDLRVIVVGGGRVGFHAAQLLDDQGHRVVIIESDSARCEHIADAYFATVIEGDGARPDVLRQADPESADVLIGATGNQGANLAACVLATRANPELLTVMRVASSAGVEGYEEVVDATFFPERVGARAAVNAATAGDLRTMEALPGELEIAEIRVLEGAPVAGRNLADVALPRGSLVISDADGDRVPGSETTLEAGQTYLVAVETEVADEVRQLFHG
jgi:trk system potassium uptake protein TrkA